MRDKMKKGLSLILAALTLSATFASCNDGEYKGELVDGYNAKAEVRSNGGFAVEKGEYIYFINAQEKNSENNKYGEVVKGALMCISKTDLENGNNDNVKRIVPSLLVSQNKEAGVFIYDNYVYYATPTTDKNLQGEVEYTYIDFKRAPLDGSAAPEDYLVRLSDNTANYRFVKADPSSEVVYCLYEEKDDAGNLYLKSYNVVTKDTTTLVKGSGLTFFYDMKNLENPIV